MRCETGTEVDQKWNREMFRSAKRGTTPSAAMSCARVEHRGNSRVRIAVERSRTGRKRFTSSSTSQWRLQDRKVRYESQSIERSRQLQADRAKTKENASRAKTQGLTRNDCDSQEDDEDGLHLAM